MDVISIGCSDIGFNKNWDKPNDSEQMHFHITNPTVNKQ